MWPPWGKGRYKHETRLEVYPDLLSLDVLRWREVHLLAGVLEGHEVVPAVAVVVVGGGNVVLRGLWHGTDVTCVVIIVQCILLELLL